MKVDILRTLQAVLWENTSSYQTDFEYDIATLREAANEPKIEESTLLAFSPLGNMASQRRM